MKNPLVKKLEEKLLPEFEKLAGQINARFPNVTVSISASSVGSQTQCQGYSFFIECFFSELEDDTDTIYFEVSLGHITTVPKICAGVKWGQPKGDTETSFRNWRGLFPDNGIMVSEEVLEELYEELPKHYNALLNALKKIETGEIK